MKKLTSMQFSRRAMSFCDFAALFALLALATWARSLLNAYLGGSSPLLTYYVVVPVVAFFCVPLVTAVFVGAALLAADFFFMVPRGTPMISDALVRIHSLFFLGISFAVCCAIFHLRRTAKSLREEIRQRERLQEELSEREALFRSLASMPTHSIWRYRLGDSYCIGEILEWWCALTGQTADQVATPGAWLEAVHEDDREGVRLFWRGIPSREEPWQYEFRVRRRDGRWRWLQIRGIRVHQAVGRMVEHAGTIGDITELKEMEGSLHQAKNEVQCTVQRLKALMDALPVGVSFSEDARCDTIIGNAVMLKQFGFDPGDNLSPVSCPPEKRLHFYADGRELRLAELPLQRALRENTSFSATELEIVTASGRRWIAEAWAAPVRNGAGEAVAGVVVTMDITERKKAEAALRRAKEEAEAADRAKTSFLANMSHELRTPMNAIIGMTDLALLTDLNEIQRKYLSFVKSGSRMLLGTINDILDLSKIESGHFQLNSETFNLHDLIEEKQTIYENLIGDKQIVFSCRIASDVPDMVQGDAFRLNQVLGNLLNNAMKFTSIGQITLDVRLMAARDDASCVQFAVRDTGIGISADKIKQLFSSFYQADASITRKYGGSGLGLAIAKSLVEKMGGKIQVSSAIDQGSCFTFTAFFGVVRQAIAMPAMATAGRKVRLIGRTAGPRSFG